MEGEARPVPSRGSRLLLRPFQLGLCWQPAREAPGWGRAGGGGTSASPAGRAGPDGAGGGAALRCCFPAGLPSGRLCPGASGRGNSEPCSAELGLARAPRKPRCGNGSLSRGLWGPSRPREVSALSSFRAFPGCCSSSSGVGAVGRVPEKGGPKAGGEVPLWESKPARRLQVADSAAGRPVCLSLLGLWARQLRERRGERRPW